jgi:hypothetical protein
MPLHRHGDRHSLTLAAASDSDHDSESESRDGPQTDTSVRLGVASTMKHALAGTSIEAQARNSLIGVMHACRTGSANCQWSQCH